MPSLVNIIRYLTYLTLLSLHTSASDSLIDLWSLRKEKFRPPCWYAVHAQSDKANSNTYDMHSIVPSCASKLNFWRQQGEFKKTNQQGRGACRSPSEHPWFSRYFHESPRTIAAPRSKDLEAHYWERVPIIPVSSHFYLLLLRAWCIFLFINTKDST